MDVDLPAVLLMGGGEGMGPIEATARALGSSLYDETVGQPIGQVLVICGRNKKLANRLLSINWKIPVQVWMIKFTYKQNGALDWPAKGKILLVYMKVTTVFCWLGL